MIIDCHGHYTVLPKAHDDWRDKQKAAFKAGEAAPPYPDISDDEIRETIEANQLRLVKERASKLNIGPDMLKRPVNVGFSGGEKKRAEILQMAVLEPSLCVLDETDSGLDIDALRVVADGVNGLRSPDRAMIVITHYQRLLDYIVPDHVHVLSRGRIVKSGGKSLALELEAKGYAQFESEAA